MMTDDDASNPNPSPYRRGGDDDYFLEYTYECDGERLYPFLPVAAVAVCWTFLRAWHVCMYFQATCNTAEMDERFYVIRCMHMTSVAAGVSCSCALLYNPLHTAATGAASSNAFRHWVTRYSLYVLAWAFYDIWLILRDRALQSAFYRTPPMLLIPLLAVVGFVVVGAYWLDLPILAGVHVVILGYATWLFMRPFANMSGLGATSPAVRSVVIRTGIGAAVHAVLLVTQLSLFAYLYTNRCVDDYDDGHGGCILTCSDFIITTPIQYVGGVVFTIHIAISHRDDVLVWRIYRNLRNPGDATENSMHSLPARKSSAPSRMKSSSVGLRSTTLAFVAEMEWEESGDGNIDSSQSGEKVDEVEFGQFSASPSNATVHNPISSQ